MKKVSLIMLLAALAIMSFCLVQCDPDKGTWAANWSGTPDVGTRYSTNNDIIEPISKYVKRFSGAPGPFGTSYVMPLLATAFVRAGNNVKLINGLREGVPVFVIVPTDATNNTNWATRAFTDPASGETITFPVYCTLVLQDINAGNLDPAAFTANNAVATTITEVQAKQYISAFSQQAFPKGAARPTYSSAFSSVSLRRENLPPTPNAFPYIRVFYALDGRNNDGIMVTASSVDGHMASIRIAADGAIANFESGLCPTNCDMY